MARNDDQDLCYIVNEVYPMIEKKVTPSLIQGYKRLMSKFIEDRATSLYDTLPCDRIVFGTKDSDAIFKLFDIDRKDIKESINKTYFGKMKAFNPDEARDETTILLLCIVRFFVVNRKKYEKELELSLIHMCFSGKFYPVIHWNSYRKFTPAKYRHIMEYVVNTKLSQKFDLVRLGSVIKAILSLAYTWVDTYEEDKFKDFDDEDIPYLIQQLHSRISSFTQNIAEVYYESYANKDEYMSYDSDNFSEDSYRLADNDSFKAERAVEKAMDVIVSRGVDVSIATMASADKIKVQELRSIIESLISDRTKLTEIKELIRILVVEYMHVSTDKDIGSISFISHSLSSKPNTKNPSIIRQKELLESWLDENSSNYRKRKSRIATKLAYNKAVLSYFVLVIHKANK